MTRYEERIQKEVYETLEGTPIAPHLTEQLHVLLSTPVGTVVLDRDFGLDHSFLDMPIPMAESMLVSELADKVEQYIPELVVSEVELIDISESTDLTVKVVLLYAE